MKDETDKRLDEEYLRSLMAGTGPDAAAHGTFPSERPEHTLPRSKSALHLPCHDYTARFLVSRPCNERQGVYIDRALHRKITALIGLLGKRNLTVGSFIDNILAYHFEQYGERIRQLCSKDLNKLF